MNNERFEQEYTSMFISKDHIDKSWVKNLKNIFDELQLPVNDPLKIIEKNFTNEWTAAAEEWTMRDAMIEKAAEASVARPAVMLSLRSGQILSQETMSLSFSIKNHILAGNIDWMYRVVVVLVDEIINHPADFRRHLYPVQTPNGGGVDFYQTMLNDIVPLFMLWYCLTLPHGKRVMNADPTMTLGQWFCGPDNIEPNNGNIVALSGLDSSIDYLESLEFLCGDSQDEYCVKRYYVLSKLTKQYRKCWGSSPQTEYHKTNHGHYLKSVVKWFKKEPVILDYVAFRVRTNKT